MLVVSLLESTFVLPSHLSHDNNLFMRFLGLALYAFRFLLKPLAWLNGVCTRGMEWFIQEIYVPVLGWTISHKRISLATGLACLITAVGLIAAGVVPFAPFPKMDSREISATVAFPNGTSANYARAEIEKLEQAIVSICDEWDRESGESIVSNTYRRIGEVGDEMQGPTGITEGSHVATVEVQLASPDVRTITSDELIRRWRERVPKISGAEVLKFGAQSMGPGGTAIEFKLLASEGSEQFLDAATARCKEYLASKVGVFDIEDDARPGKSEVVFRLNELGKALGLDENQLASTIRTGFYGDEVMRLQRGRHEVKLMVRYPAGERRSFASLENVRVRDTAGRERPLSEVATWEYRRAFSDIKRQNQKRAVTITADVDAKEAVSTEIINEMKSTFIPGLLDEFRQSHGAVLAVDWDRPRRWTHWPAWASAM
jgi:hydrophobic/amphiphilic exporter-1 (mainly G- bacteria), HAE1 family